MIPRSQITVLTIEDDEVHSYVLRRRLTHFGYQPINAESGADASTMLDRADVLVSSVALADMNGLELCERVRETHRQLPVILLSHVRPSKEDLAAAERAGVSGWLQLPLEPEQLSRKIDELVSSRSR